MSLSFNISKFQSLFPNADVSSSKVEYEVEDSQYRVYNPTWDSQQKALVIRIDHIRGGATDDHAELSLTFNGDASLAAISGTWKAGNDGYKIPQVVIGAVDLTAEIIAAAGAVETGGTSEVVLNVAVAAFDGFCELFNTLSPILVKLSDDGGRLYTMAVVCHTVNRACSSISVKYFILSR